MIELIICIMLFSIFVVQLFVLKHMIDIYNLLYINVGYGDE